MLRNTQLDQIQPLAGKSVRVALAQTSAILKDTTAELRPITSPLPDAMPRPSPTTPKPTKAELARDFETALKTVHIAFLIRDSIFRLLLQ